MTTFDPATTGAESSPSGGRPIQAIKLPQITVVFWVTLLLTAGLGQLTFDWLIVKGVADPGVIAPILGSELALFVITLILQLMVRRYLVPVYWLAVLGVSVFGTLLADVAHFLIGIPLWASPIIFALVVAVIFLLWYRAERTLSINSVRTRRREASYWFAVLFIFALGTAVVDLVTTGFNVSGLTSGIVFLVLFVVASALSVRTQRAPAFLFWAAYLVVRPASGSFSDWLTNGLGLDASLVALVALLLVMLLIGYSALSGSRLKDQAL